LEVGVNHQHIVVVADQPDAVLDVTEADRLAHESAGEVRVEAETAHQRVLPPARRCVQVDA
jgi:hypothetical protein